jgi:hypothetical protein
VADVVARLRAAGAEAADGKHGVEIDISRREWGHRGGDGAEEEILLQPLGGAESKFSLRCRSGGKHDANATDGRSGGGEFGENVVGGVVSTGDGHRVVGLDFDAVRISVGRGGGHHFQRNQGEVATSGGKILALGGFPLGLRLRDRGGVGLAGSFEIGFDGFRFGRIGEARGGVDRRSGIHSAVASEAGIAEGVEEGEEAEVITLGNGIVFVIVALRAGHREPEEGL